MKSGYKMGAKEVKNDKDKNALSGSSAQDKMERYDPATIRHLIGQSFKGD